MLLLALLLTSALGFHQEIDSDAAVGEPGELSWDDAEAAVGGSSSFFVSNDEDTVDDYGLYACNEKEGTKNAGGVWFCSDWYGYDCDGDVTLKCPVCCNPPTAPSAEEKARLESKYPAITSGTCGSNGMYDITTKSDCTKAIEIRNLFTSEANYKFNKVTTSKKRAGGCVVSTTKGNKGYVLSETGTATERSTASAAYVYFCKPEEAAVAAEIAIAKKSELEKGFDEVDTNGNGALTRAELGVLFVRMFGNDDDIDIDASVDAMFTGMDDDHSSTIDFAEYKRLATAPNAEAESLAYQSAAKSMSDYGVYGFALIGFSVMMYGAGRRFCSSTKEQEYQHVEI